MARILRMSKHRTFDAAGLERLVHVGKRIVHQSYVTAFGQCSINETASNYNDASISSVRQVDGGD
jgi:hypothetical protein